MGLLIGTFAREVAGFGRIHRARHQLDRVFLGVVREFDVTRRRRRIRMAREILRYLVGCHMRDLRDVARVHVLERIASASEYTASEGSHRPDRQAENFLSS